MPEIKLTSKIKIESVLKVFFFIKFYILRDFILSAV